MLASERPQWSSTEADQVSASLIVWCWRLRGRPGTFHSEPLIAVLASWTVQSDSKVNAEHAVDVPCRMPQRIDVAKVASTYELLGPG